MRYIKLKINDIKFNPMIALLSVCIFIFFYGFFKDVPDKQHITELFLMLIILLSIIEIRYKNVFNVIFICIESMQMKITLRTHFYILSQ